MRATRPTPGALEALQARMIECRACARLVRWREQVARIKAPRFRDWEYWGRPVPGFGDPKARLVLVGLAPAAHGGNRTGRVFTGDRSGDFLFSALHRAGFANQPTSVSRDDGLRLHDVFILAPVRCAPPDNMPLPEELSRCSAWFDAELDLLPKVRVMLALGAVAWASVLLRFERRGVALPRPRPRFAHGAEVRLPGAPVLLGCYHVSQQNTNTRKLTPAMMDALLARAAKLASERE